MPSTPDDLREGDAQAQQRNADAQHMACAEVDARLADWVDRQEVHRHAEQQRRRLVLRRCARGRHSSGPGIAARLGATYPPARAEPHFEANAETLARAGLFGIAARRDCPFHPATSPCGEAVDSSLLL